MKIGILGERGHTVKFANMIRKHDGFEPVVLHAANIAVGKKKAEEAGLIFEEDFDRFLHAYDLGAVLITASNAYKEQYVIDCANAGMHIFLEKPMGIKKSSAQRMADAVNQNNVKFFMTDPSIGPGVLYAKQIMESGEIGEVNEAVIRIAQLRLPDGGHPPMYEKNIALGGIASDVAVHGLHIMQYLFGRPCSVQCCMQKISEQAIANDIEETVNALFTLKDNSTVSVQASWRNNATDHVTLYGTKGYLIVKGFSNNTSVTLQVDGSDPVIVEDLPKPPMAHVDYFLKMIEEDLDNGTAGMIAEGMSGTNLEQAVELTELVEAMYLADKNKETVWCH